MAGLLEREKVYCHMIDLVSGTLIGIELLIYIKVVMRQICFGIEVIVRQCLKLEFRW